MNRILPTLIFLIVVNPFYSQTLKVNSVIDTTIFKNFKEPLDLWLDFLNADSDSVAAQYWNKDELSRYGSKSYFLTKHGISMQGDFHKNLRKYRLDFVVIDICQIKDAYSIKSSISLPRKDSTIATVVSIFNIFVKKVDGEFKLYNALIQNTIAYCNTTNIGYINFHHLKIHDFDYELAKKQSDFYLKFSQDFEVPIDTVDYYFAPNNIELQRLRGFDYVWGQFTTNTPSGIADVNRKIVYSTGLNEYYPHEFIHILISPVYYNDCHDWFDEGLATFYGMSRGKELDWHLKRFTMYLKENPTIDLDSMLNYSNMDSFTGFKYVLGGYFMKKAFEKGGIPLQKKFLVTGKEDWDFYYTIEKYLGIKQKQLNEVIRKELYEIYLND